MEVKSSAISLHKIVVLVIGTTEAVSESHGKMDLKCMKLHVMSVEEEPGSLLSQMGASQSCVVTVFDRTTMLRARDSIVIVCGRVDSINQSSEISDHLIGVPSEMIPVEGRWKRSMRNSIS